jgi:hypothetical protein
MEANETRITRITRALGSVTSLFRCHGLHFVPANADSIGGHDLFYWAAFLVMLSGWFLFIYMPQCRRLERLTGRQQSLALEFETDKKELTRLQRGISSLTQGDPVAWERAARGRLGWLEPGEVLDVEKWKRSRAASNGSVSEQPSRAPQRPALPAPPPMLPRPTIPRIPRRSAAPSVVAQTMLRSQASMRFADSGAFGPTIAKPPLPPAPAIPALPHRPLPSATAPRQAIAQPVGYTYGFR